MGTDTVVPAGSIKPLEITFVAWSKQLSPNGLRICENLKTQNDCPLQLK